MASPYVYERQVEYWTARDIEGFFLDAGFEVVVFPLTQLTEANVPADFLFYENTLKKMFGLQFKALYRNGDDFWNLDLTQHQQLQRYPWMYYGLSDLASARQYRNALHYLRVLPPTFDFRRRLSRTAIGQPRGPAYMRWAAFYEGLQKCTSGVAIHSPEELRQQLWPGDEQLAPREITDLVDEVFIAEPAAGRVARFSRQLSEHGGRAG